MGSKIMEALELVLPLISQMTGEDVQVSLCDRTTALATWPAKSFKMPAAQPGLQLEWDNPAQRGMLEVMERGVQVVNFLPKEVLGSPIKGILTPVFEDGEVVGLVACAYSMEQEIKIQESIQQLDLDLLKAKDRIDEIAKESVNLADKMNSISEVTESVKDAVDNASGMVTMIQKNASKSNILALNASIEAARAGDVGRGFSVVASEMSKLSHESGSSAKEISQSLQDITNAVKKVESAVDEANRVATVQATNTNEINSTLSEVTSSVKEITGIVSRK